MSARVFFSEALVEERDVFLKVQYCHCEFIETVAEL